MVADAKEFLSDPSQFRTYNLDKTKQYLQDAVDKGQITKSDFETIKKYIMFKTGQNVTGQTLHLIAVTLVRMREYIPTEYKNLDIEILQESINTFKNSTIPTHSHCHSGRKHKVNTQVHYVNETKAFLKWCIDEGHSKIDPSKLDKIRPPKVEKQTFGPSDILAKEEIDAIIRACDNIRDRAFISALYDGGFRTIELSTMTWGDLDWVESEEHEGRYIVAAKTSKKTGIPRRVLLTRSGQFLNEWKNQYSIYSGGAIPTGDNVIFINRKMKPFSYVTVSKILEKLKKKVKEQGLDLDKKLKPHAFRRASITHESNDNRPIAHICMERWGKSYSPQILRYNQPDLEAIDASKMEMTGIPTKRKYNRHEKVLEPKLCPDCGLLNKPLNNFCSRCGRGLTEEARKQVEQERGVLREAGKDLPEDRIQAMIDQAVRAALANKK